MRLLRQFLEYMRRREEARHRRFWDNMTDEEAAEIDAACIHEGCAVMGGEFLKNYREYKTKKNAHTDN